MKTIDLYLKIIKHVRYEVLGSRNFCLNDFEQGSKGYDLLCRVNEACNDLSALLDVMNYEKD